jgi:hypothetical protein
MSMGRAREWLVPALYLGVPLAMLIASFYALRALVRIARRVRERFRARSRTVMPSLT